jgi:predicted nucleotidyltransferase
LGFSNEAFGSVISALRDAGLDGVVIGGTCIELALGKKYFEGDVDLFSTTLSPTFDEEDLRKVAESCGCSVGQIGWGVARLMCEQGNETVEVEVYENMFDVYVPQDFIDDAIEYRVGNAIVKALRPEHHIVLKARAGREKDLEDLRNIAVLVLEGKLGINHSLIEKAISKFDEEEQKVIERRLRDSGLY